MERPEYSVVIPVYNSGAWLPELVSRITRAMTGTGKPFEILLVNDASPDRSTWPVIQKVAQEEGHVRGFDMLYNVGQFRALLCGFEQARGEFIITMDDDLQHPPEELPKLVRAMQEHPDMDCVMGLYESKSHSLFRNIGSVLVQKVMNKLYEKPEHITTTSFRIMKREVAEIALLYRTANPQLGPLIVRITRRIMNVPVEHHPRSRGKSGYGLRVLMRETLRSVVNASLAPLRLVSGIGMFFAAAAFVWGAALIVLRLLGDISVAGYTSLIVAIAFFSGMILFSIGILGEYIGRIINEISGMPRYTIRSHTGEEKP